MPHHNRERGHRERLVARHVRDGYVPKNQTHDKQKNAVAPKPPGYSVIKHFLFHRWPPTSATTKSGHVGARHGSHCLASSVVCVKRWLAGGRGSWLPGCDNSCWTSWIGIREGKFARAPSNHHPSIARKIVANIHYPPAGVAERSRTGSQRWETANGGQHDDSTIRDRARWMVRPMCSSFDHPGVGC